MPGVQVHLVEILVNILLTSNDTNLGGSIIYGSRISGWMMSG